MTYEQVLREMNENSIDVCEVTFKGNGKAYYAENTVFINKNLDDREKKCVLVEEWGHHKTTYGSILDMDTISNIKQEKYARNWGYKKLVGINDILNAYKAGTRNKYEMAEYLNVTEDFLEEAIYYYSKKHPYYEIDNYIICFDPLGIVEKIEDF